MMKGYSRIGVRVCTEDENYQVGDTCRDSFDWDYENDVSTYNTDNPISLGGACAVEIIIEDDMSDKEIMELIKSKTYNYGGGTKVLIGGHESEYGSDESEIIIVDAEVLKVF